jgi:hypothetical protein
LKHTSRGPLAEISTVFYGFFTATRQRWWDTMLLPAIGCPVRTLRATLIAGSSLTALLLTGCATTSEQQDHAPTARYSHQRAPAKVKHAPAVQKIAVSKAVAEPARPAPMPTKVSPVSEPPSVRIADPQPKLAPKSEPKADTALQPAPVLKKADVPLATPAPKTATTEAAKPAMTPQPAPAAAQVQAEPKISVVPTTRPAIPQIVPAPKAAEVKPEPKPEMKPVDAKAAEPKAAEVKLPELAKSVEAAKGPDAGTVEAKAAEARPLTQTRLAPQASAPPQAQAVPLPQPNPAAVAAPVAKPVAQPVAQPVPAAQPATTPTGQAAVQSQTVPAAQAQAPTAPPAASPASTIPPSAPVPVRQAAVDAAPVQAAPVSPQQRTSDGLSRAADYMAAGRIVNARSLLEDQARSGDPAILKALAETYDPLHLTDAYPKLSRAGDPVKAMAAYERAKTAGAKDLDPRMDALRALIARKQ